MACCCSRSKKTMESTSHPLEWAVKHINMTKLRQVNMSILYFEKPSTSHWLNMSINKVKGSPLCAFTVWGPVCSAGLYIAHIMACLASLKRLSRFLWSEAVGWDICSHVSSLIAANVQKLWTFFKTSCQNGQMCTPENGARSDFMRDTIHVEMCSQIIRLHLVTFLKLWKNKFDFIH